MSNPIARRIVLVIAAMTVAACASPTGPTSQANAVRRATVAHTMPTVKPMCDGGVATGTGQC
jgi:hypothetical protein